MIHIGLVERGTFQALEVAEILIATRLEPLAGPVVLRRHLELRYEIDRRFLDTGVINDHTLGELLDVFGVRLRSGEFAGVDVDLVPRDHDAGTLCASGPLASCPSDRYAPPCRTTPPYLSHHS